MLDMIGAEPEYQSDVKFQVSAAKVLYKLDTINWNHINIEILVSPSLNQQTNISHLG